MKSSKNSVRDVLNTSLFPWPGHSSDKFTVRNAVEGIQIFGATGSGKSSGSAKRIARSYLEHGFGGLVLCAKPDEREVWEKYIKEAGRDHDKLVFDSESGLQFNPIRYEMERDGEGAGQTLNLVELIMVLFEISRNFSAGGGGSGKDERFWDNAVKRAIGRVIDLLYLGNQEVTIENMRKVISTAPNSTEAKQVVEFVQQTRNPEEQEHVIEEANNALERWKSRSYCVRCLLTALDTEDFDKEERSRNDLVQSYFFREFARLADRTKSIVEESFLGLVEYFNSGLLKAHFSGHVSPELFPEQAYLEKKIIILDFPVKEHLLAGVLAAGIYKYLFQQSMERRKIEDNGNLTPVFLWVDESQFYLSQYDQLFATTARSSLTSIVYLTQNINNYYVAMGDDNSEAKTKSLLGNLTTKIYHANSDFETNEYASKAIGERFRQMTSIQKQSSNPASPTFSEQLFPQVLAGDFTTLQKGGNPSNGYKTEAIITQTGHMWSNDLNYLKVKFNQRD
ncbi:TraM recognition domain-containing protein [Ekhidna sp.]|uniref:type IV secretory system conjugative DNA transfer family protein n=1 Tax=Ekhidna sp. TaxID=2608089 RepID=UPI0032ED5612